MYKKVIQKILVPIDYSANSERAARAGISLAKELGAEVFLFHSYHLPAVGLAEGIIVADDIKLAERKKIDQHVTEFKTEFGDVKIHPILEFGSATDWIKTKVVDYKIDLIVMGTKGSTDATNSILGSVASHVINKVKCPVLVIPKGHKTYNINEVLFATDYHFTDNAALYLSPFLTLVNEFQPYVHVVKFSPFKTSSQHIRNIEEIKLTEILKETKHSFHIVESENTEADLFKFSEKYHCDLIVTVTRHYTLWEKIFHQSLSKKLVLHSETPVLVLHEY